MKLTLRDYLLDQARLILFWLVGICLLLALFCLYITSRHVNYSLAILLYGAGLGLFPLVLHLGIDYWQRRPFYLAVNARLDGERVLEEALTLDDARTREQRALQDLLHAYYYSYEKELRGLEEQRKFTELFVNRFAHQMKTPLTVIQLLEGELQGEGQPGIAASLQEERNRLDQSINMMLQTARLHEFSLDSRMETVELLALLRGIINEHKTEWIRYRLFPKIECDREEVFVRTDLKWFGFLCDQIVRNALQYGSKTAEGQRVPGSFWLRVRDGEDAVEVQFQDFGIGIPAEDVRYVFQPFYTGRNGRTHSRATGMGLYLVKTAAQRLGHTVELHSVEGEGTTVTLRLAKSGYYEVARNMTTL
ncbi:sensor histidine kinase [Tumebacillus flagellatus]|nr:sensor histidine kinase [Tumebacillus flagellatus]